MTPRVIKSHRSKVSVCIFNHEKDAISPLSIQWLCGNLCTCSHEVRLHIAGTHKPKSAQQAKQGAQY